MYMWVGDSIPLEHPCILFRHLGLSLLHLFSTIYPLHPHFLSLVSTYQISISISLAHLSFLFLQHLLLCVWLHILLSCFLHHQSLVRFCYIKNNMHMKFLPMILTFNHETMILHQTSIFHAHENVLCFGYNYIPTGILFALWLYICASQHIFQ